MHVCQYVALCSDGNLDYHSIGANESRNKQEVKSDEPKLND